MERLTERRGLCVKAIPVGDFGSQNVLHRLAEYEDAEEQGLLVNLPCKVGSTVYWLTAKYGLVERSVTSFDVVSGGNVYVRLAPMGYDNEPYAESHFSIPIDEFDSLIFINKEEAEEALKKMKKRGM